MYRAGFKNVIVAPTFGCGFHGFSENNELRLAALRTQFAPERSVYIRK